MTKHCSGPETSLCINLDGRSFNTILRRSRQTGVDTELHSQVRLTSTRHATDLGHLCLGHTICKVVDRMCGENNVTIHYGVRFCHDSTTYAILSAGRTVLVVVVAGIDRKCVTKMEQSINATGGNAPGVGHDRNDRSFWYLVTCMLHIASW